MSSTVQCEACAKVGRRRAMRCAPDGWLYAEMKIQNHDTHDTEDMLVVVVCSDLCASRLWHPGPGDLTTVDQSPISYVARSAELETRVTDLEVERLSLQESTAALTKERDDLRAALKELRGTLPRHEPSTTVPVSSARALVVHRTLVTIETTLKLNEAEARALDALVGYGTDAFLKVFYKQLGEAYMRDYEVGLRSVFDTIRASIPAALRTIDAARKALAEVARG